MFGQLGSFAKMTETKTSHLVACRACLEQIVVAPNACCPICKRAVSAQATRNAAVQRGEYHTFDVSYDVDEMKMEMDVGINNYTKKSFFSRCNFARITPNDRCVFFFVAFCVDSSVA